MTTHTHTPGPWTAVDYSGTDAYSEVWADGLSPLVDGESTYLSHADARLIAAAPDLLAALRGAADALREAGRSFIIHNPLAARPNLFELHEAAAREAIARAEWLPRPTHIFSNAR